MMQLSYVRRSLRARVSTPSCRTSGSGDNFSDRLFVGSVSRRGGLRHQRRLERSALAVVSASQTIPHTRRTGGRIWSRWSGAPSVCHPADRAARRRPSADHRERSLPLGGAASRRSWLASDRLHSGGARRAMFLRAQRRELQGESLEFRRQRVCREECCRGSPGASPNTRWRTHRGRSHCEPRRPGST